MSDTTPNLSLPFIQPNQAQKHVTHNEAIAALDVVVQLTIDMFDLTDPPSAPTEGSAYGLGASPNAEFALYPNHIAAWTGLGWVFLAPKIGWRAWSKPDQSMKVWDGANWVDIVPDQDFNNLSGLGVNASFDATNRFTVSSGATLLNHEGAGHQLKINKNGQGDTASILFQSNWSGHAEMGLAGNNNFAIKTSADGSSFQTVLSTDSQTGIIDGKAFRSKVLQLSDDAAGTIEVPSSGGFMMITAAQGTEPEPLHSGFFVYGTGGAPALETMIAAGNVQNQGTSVLDGTTGGDGNTSVSVSSGQLWIENRSGAAQNYSITFIGGL